MYLDIGNYIMKDFLSLYFLGVIILVSIPVFIYSIGYISEYKEKYSIAYLWSMMVIFVLSMAGVVLAADGISFIIFWELMSVFSFLLVIYEHRKSENIRSGIMYFIMTHISGLFVMIMFIVIGKFSGTMNFHEIIKYSVNFTSYQKAIILILALFAFGAKAGLLPLHAWLPKAHPSAPSNVSALMSGVMLKIALYGFIRVSFMFIGKVPLFYAVLIMLVGAVTAIFSIINALFQNDIKKLLAYSSAENMGIIFAALGLSLGAGSCGLKAISFMALTAALFHILNHAVFKSLLFAGAGSVLYATSTKNMNELGGLYKKMKAAAIFTFIGTAGIAAIPPLSGFSSEILILRSFIEAVAEVKIPELAITVVFCGIVLALTSGGVIWASVKSFGMVFLGEPRTEKAANAHEIPGSMKVGMGILAALTVISGMFSPFLINYIYSCITQSSGAGITSYEITIISGIMLIVGIILCAVMKLTKSDNKSEIYETWGCGYGSPKSFMQYSSSGYTQPAERVVGIFADYRKEVKIKDTVYLRQRVRDIVETNLYTRATGAVDFLASKIIKIHYGKIQIYISYLFIALILSLILVVKFV